MTPVESVATKPYLLTADRMLDGKGGTHQGQSVLVRDGKIAKVGPRGTFDFGPKGPIELALPGCTLLPGLIDAHIHLAAQNVYNFDNYRTATFEVTPQLQQMYSLLHAQMCLEMGYTTLRDMSWITPRGLFTNEMVAVRDAINNEIFAGPRIIAGGWSVMTFAHLELLLPHHAMRAVNVTADGPWALRRMVREQLRDGADFIKTCASGGGGTDHQDARGILNMTEEELGAIVDEAHMLGKRVATHAWTPESQKRAMRAGTDTLEHCVRTDAEAIEMMLKTGTSIVPTLAVRTNHALSLVEKAGASAFVMENYRRHQTHCFETFKKVHQAGVKIAAGTDLNVQPNMGENAIELEMYVELGMTPMEAITAATSNAAEACGLGKQIGAIEAGRVADILAVRGNPDENIKLLRDRSNIELVMRDGNVLVGNDGESDKRPIHRRRWDWLKVGGVRAGGCCGVDR
jgi:imidazolonepropionase-like amidohydrolase